MFRRVPRFVPAVVLTGVAGGVVGAGYVLVFRLGMRLVGPTRLPWTIEAMALLGAGVLVAIGSRILGPPGTVELLVDNIHVRGGPEGMRGLASLVPLSLACIIAGSPIGPEAPLVETCGTVGATIARRLGLGQTQVRTLTLAGMAAAFTVLFGTPAGAAVFALELPNRGGLGYGEALVPVLAGALAGEAMFVVLTGLGIRPVWTLPALGARTPSDLLWAAGCGVVGAGGAYAFVGAHRLFAAILARVPGALRPITAGAAIAALAALSPAALTFGEGQVGAIAVGGAIVATLVLAAAVKGTAAALAVAGRWPGGFIIPMFFIGFALGRAAHLAFPASDGAMLMAALAAALCTGVTKTPLGAALVITGMTGLTLLPTTLLAAVVALLLSRGTGMIGAQRPATQDPEASP